VSDQSSQLSNEPLRLDVSRSQVQALGSILQGLVAQYRGLVTLEKMAAEGPQTGNQRPVIERLHEFSGDKVDLSNLVPYPPKMQPIPVKPLFLDVAWNYIDYPREGAQPQEEAQGPMETGTEEKKGGRRGWFGFGR
jgi:signal recognition particle subunit SRP68